MCKVPVQLRELVKQRLAAAAEEIFELLEKTMREYQEETERQKRLMETLLQPCVLLNATENGAMSVQPSEWDSSLPPHIKEEQEEESSSQEARDIITSQLWEREDTAPPSEFEDVLATTQISKSEDEESPETWTQPVHHNQTVDCPEPPVPVAPPGNNLLHLNNTEADRTRGIYSRQFIYSFCPQRIDSNNHLQNHMSVHTGDGPFSCSVCGKRFSLKRNMEQHKKTHSGLRPYTCTVCKKAFVKKCNLNDHLLIHTGEKPFRCSLCGKWFRQRSTLKKHMSTHRQNL